jgi:2-haloacid dehalogenase
VRADSTTPAASTEAIVFDLGGVFIEWNPRNLYRKLIPSEAVMEHFLETICTPTWHLQLDAGVSFTTAAEPLMAKHRPLRSLIQAYNDRFDEMWGAPSSALVQMLAEIQLSGVPTYAATNWPGEYWKLALDTFPFLRSFDGALVSGLIGVTKPSPAFYQTLTTTFSLTPARTLFIDDRLDNVYAASKAGYRTHQFLDNLDLRTFLLENGLSINQGDVDEDDRPRS